MDALHYKIFKPGMQCWALIASIEEPFVYLPVYMDVFEAHQVNTLRYHYSMRLIDFVDDVKTVERYFNNHSFRQYNYDRDRLHDTKIEIDSTLFNSTTEYADQYNVQHADEFFQVLAPLAFETKQQCLSSLKDLESRLAEKFANTLNFYRNRYVRWKSNPNG